MPPRTRAQIFAGFAFLSLCAGGVGCQTSSYRTEYHAARNVGGPGPLLTLFQRPTPSPATPVERNVIASTSPVGSSPRPSAPTTAVQASVWEPVQHVKVEKPAVAPTGVARASASASTGGAVRASLDAPVLQPIAIASSLQPNDPAPVLKQPRLEPQPVVIGPSPVMLQPSVPREFAKQPLPPYVVEPPDILLVNAGKTVTLEDRPIDGQHLIRPDGTISLGVYGSVYVAGLTLDEARDAIAAKIQLSVNKKTVEDIKKELVVDVLAYNSKVYYVITDGAGYGAQVYPIPITGNETVLDALAKINGLPMVASKKRIWVARATAHETDHPEILPVDWCAIAERGSSATNYQIFPNDRIYVGADKWITTENWLSKRLNIFDRLAGSALLGSSLNNSIRGRTSNTVP
jgi:polysaccharide biosynthesis/export protein